MKTQETMLQPQETMLQPQDWNWDDILTQETYAEQRQDHKDDARYKVKK